MIVWIALGLGLLTFCGGQTDDAFERRRGRRKGSLEHRSTVFGSHGCNCTKVLRIPVPEWKRAGARGEGRSGRFCGDGFAGHTGSCTRQCGCPGTPFAQACGGAGGQGGFSGQTGFGGHTSSCIGTCGGNCPPCPIEAGTDANLRKDATAKLR